MFLSWYFTSKSLYLKFSSYLRYCLVFPTLIHSKPNHLIDRRSNHPQPHHPNLTPSSPPPHPHPNPTVHHFSLGWDTHLYSSLDFSNKFFKAFIAICYQRANGEMTNRSNETKKGGRRGKHYKGKQISHSLILKQRNTNVLLLVFTCA